MFTEGLGVKQERAIIQISNFWSIMVYAVIGVNNRGSSGYGKTFYHMDDKRHGEEDLLDVVWAKKYLQGLDWIDF